LQPGTKDGLPRQHIPERAGNATNLSPTAAVRRGYAGFAPHFCFLLSAFLIFFRVALGWLWGAYQVAINTLWGGFDVALMWLWAT
jgi:hypothetical protein